MADSAHILVVDDDLSIRRMFQQLLSGTGYRVSTAGSAEEALGYLDLITPDLIMMDLNLPLLFASNALYPLVSMPGWVRAIAMLNPTTYLIDALRAVAFEGTASLALPLSLGVIVAFAVAGMLLALWAFRRSIQS